MKTPSVRHVFVFLSKWFASLAIAVIFVVGGIEIALRIGNVGENTSVFKSVSLDGRRFFVSNESYFKQFFTVLPKVSFDWGDAEAIVPAEKSEGAFRVFVFGSSDALGLPDPAFSFSRFLETMLRHRYPKTTFEFYSLCYPATNSHVLLPMVKSALKLEPDLLVVYTGNNEAIGPFGPMTRLGSPPWASRWFIRASMALNSLRIGQLARGGAALTGIPKGIVAPSFFEQFMPVIRSNDPRLRIMYDRFRANILDVCTMAKSSRVPVVVCTLTCNLCDSRPAISHHREGLSQELRNEWEERYGKGLDLQRQGMPEPALAEYGQALDIDSYHAMLQYLAGHCYLQLNDYDKAGQHFLAAVQNDFLRLRLSPRTNVLLREVAAAREPEGIFLADTALAVAAHSPEGIPGFESFYDDVHPTPKANYRIAASILETISGRIAALESGVKADGGKGLSEQACYARLGLTPACLLRVYTDVDSLPMPRLQPDMIPRERANYFAYQRRREELVESAGPDRLSSEALGYENALREVDGDYLLLHHLTSVMSITGPKDGFLEHAEKMVSEFPHRRASRRLLADALDQSKDFDAALSVLRENRALFPDDNRTLNQIALTLDRAGRLPEAYAAVQEAIAANPHGVEARQLEWEILLHMGREEDAAHAIEASFAFLPDLAPAYVTLQELYQRLCGPEEASGRWRALVTRYPQTPAVYFALSRACAEEGDIAGSKAAAEKQSELSPEFGKAQSGRALYQAHELRDRGDAMGAMRLYRLAITLDPENCCAYAALGGMLEHAGRFDEALLQFETSIRTVPEYIPPYIGFDRVIARLDPTRRLEEWRRLTRLCPESGFAFLHLGLALKEEDQMEEAREALAHALALTPEDPVVQAHAREASQ